MALTRPRLGQLNSSIVAQSDPITVLNQGSAAANVDVGFLFNRANGLVSNVALYWSESAQSIVTAYTSSTGSTNSNISVTSYANLTVGNVLTVNGGIIGIVGNLTLGNLIANTGVYAVSSVVSGNVFAGNVLASGFFYANGTPFTSSSYGNTTVASYLPVYSGSIGAATEIVTLTANAGAQANQIAGANAAIVTANTALKGYTDNQISTANTALKGYTDNQISTANTALKAYVDTQDSAITSAWTANAGAQANQIAGANAAIVTANTAVVSYVNTQITTTQSWVTGANAAIVTANTALKAYTDAQITTTQSWVTGANAAIITANTALKSYVDTQDSAITTAWTSNAGAQANQIAGANAAIITANSAVVSLVNTLNTAMSSNVAGANAAIVTANTAIKSYVDAQITNLTNGAPAILDTLGEIATSLGNNASLSTTLLNSISGSNAAIVTANTALKSYVDTQITTTQSWVTGANAAIVTANTALKSYVDTQITTTQGQITTANTALKSYVDTQDSAITTAWTSNAGAQANQITGANAAIVTANTAMKSYVDAVTTAWTGNAGAQANQIAGANVAIARIDANLGSFQTYANLTFSTTINPAVYFGKVTASTAPTLIDTVPVAGNSLVRWTTTSYDSVYNQYRSGIIDSVNNGTEVYYTDYGVIVSNVGTTVATFTSNITAGNINLYAVGNTASVAVTYQRTVLGSGTTSGYLTAGPAGATGATGTIANTASWIVTTNSTASTSTTTGALQVAGGAGIAGNIYAGNVYSSGNVVATTYFVGNGSQLTGISSAMAWTITSSNITVSKNNGYFVDTTTGPKTLTLPASNTIGDTVRINDLAGTFASNNLTVGANGGKIQGVAEDLLVSVNQKSFGLVYSNSTYGWKLLEL